MPAPKINHEISSNSSAAVSTQRAPARLFISGHSLTDQPLPDYLESIARSMDKPLQWNRQYVVGSAIITRTRGRDVKADTWSGYRSGFNRNGKGLDVISELHDPKTVQGGPYDALIITEQHGLLGSLTWADTVRYLRHYHERLIEGNPRATTYFYESWLSLNDKSDPRRWIAYERAASPVWQCIATRINVSLQDEGRSDRIKSLPAGAALADLVERATQPAGLSGISLGSVRKTVDSIIKDNVHLTELGSYYAALVTYSIVYAKSPEGAWHPPGIDTERANTLQQVAWDFASNYVRTNTPLTLAECQAINRKSFIDTYWAYVRDAAWMKELNPVHAYLRWVRYVVKWHWLIRRENTDNPFYYDRGTDRQYWLPRP